MGSVRLWQPAQLPRAVGGVAVVLAARSVVAAGGWSTITFGGGGGIDLAQEPVAHEHAAQRGARVVELRARREHGAVREDAAPGEPAAW